MRSKGRTNLYAASRQWAERPADERFWTLGELHDRAKEYAEQSVTQKVALSECVAVELPGDDLGLAGPNGNTATFQNYSFGQLCGLAQAPASYLRGLPADVASTCLTHGLQQIRGEQVLMSHKNGGLQLRCVTSDSYSRIWNYEVAELALALQEQEGWVTPPARPCGDPNVPVRLATEADVLHKTAHPSMGVKVGDEISPAGLYVSDHDLFIFQVNEDYGIDAGGGEMLYRGVFWSNSEVGDARFRGTMFLYDSVCGNHIVWGARVVAEISIRHTGKAAEMFRTAMVEVTSGMERSAKEDQARIAHAKQYVLGPDKTTTVDMVFRRNLGLTKDQCEGAYRMAEIHEEDHNAAPNSAWGFCAGLTRLSQGVYADKRDAIDRAAGRVMELSF